ncbi:Uncharacterized conserved protein, DUF2267 family [Halomicrobium zhouii]|uniref:Uncharacterized conserved protein, DUF2267 family n=1 Tax=Halomicrobium zhouii TaxID=767519 RepID=A0A1I6M1Y2_9EURY|nr:DUF2267 domain-containing protein [Halomicrobium zhouii]SFS09705.1 Uncharacterized conserved protein, DUF2267 family [Halomicrobium zhouii]
MDRDDILDATARRAGLDSERAAERAVLATMTTLGEHVSKEESQQMAAQLPPEISDAMTSRSTDSPEEFAVDEFVDRVASREGGEVSEEEAVVHTRAVVATLAEAGVGTELQDAREQLPDEFDTLFETDDLDAE